MASRLKELRSVDPVLTEVAQGYSNAELIAEALFPLVPMNKEAGKVPVFGKEAFRIYSSERAIRAKSNVISPEARTTVDVLLNEHDLAYPLDYREEDEDEFDLQEYATFAAQGGIQLRRERIAADLAQDDTNFPTGHKVTLSGSSQFTHADSDPFATFKTARQKIRSVVAKKPNVMVMGDSVFEVLKEHPKVIERVKYSERAVITEEILRNLFEVETLAVGKTIWVNDAGTPADIWSDNVILAYIPAANMRSRYEPSFGYTFRKRSFPEVDVYPGEGGKVRYVRSTDIFLPKIVGAEAGYLIKDTNE